MDWFRESAIENTWLNVDVDFGTDISQLPDPGRLSLRQSLKALSVFLEGNTHMIISRSVFEKYFENFLKELIPCRFWLPRQPKGFFKSWKSFWLKPKCLESLDNRCVAYAPRVKIGHAPGFTCFTQRYIRKKLWRIVFKSPWKKKKPWRRVKRAIC